MFNRQSTRRALLCLAALALILGWGPAIAAIPIQHWTQPSGVKVYLVESPSLPMVDVRIDFDAGGRRDPAQQAGLASATAGMTSKGILAAREGTAGTTAYPQAMDENQLSEAWADLGAGFNEGASSDRMSFSLRSLSFPDILPKAVQLAARQLGEPSFPRRSGSANASALPRRSARPTPVPAPWPAAPTPRPSMARIRTATR